MWLRSCLAGLFVASVVLVAWADAPPTAKRRVPAPKDAPDPKALPTSTVKRLDVLEAALGDPKSELRQLHAEAVQAFVKNPGFGMTRMVVPFKTEAQVAWTTDDLEREPADVKASELEPLHLASVLSLTFRTPLPHLGPGPAPTVKTDGPHSVRTLHVRARYRVQKLNLVGLLTHDEPTVYRTPEWLEPGARGQETRPIDPFEAAGLDRLRTGDDLFIRQRPGQAFRLLGAIRATDGCLKCHDGRRGDLLGAFSYHLVKAAR